MRLFVKPAIITCLAALGLNFAPGNYTVASAYPPLTAGHQAAEIRGCCNEPVPDKISSVMVSNTAADVPLAHENYIRTVDIGFASEGQNMEDFLIAVEKANKLLSGYRIFLQVKENVRVNVPYELSRYDIAYGIDHSFSHFLDYYFAWTSADYSIKDGDFAVLALTSKRVSLIDSDFPSTSLDRLIAQEILRYFSNSEDAEVYQVDDDYFADVDKKTVLSNLEKKTAEQDYQLNTNLEKRRVVTVTVALDNVDEEYAKKLLSQASDMFNKEFNIAFQPVEFLNHELPDVWNSRTEMMKIRDTADKQSDLYLLFTNGDVDKNKVRDLGKANPDYGYALITTKEGFLTSFRVLVHELGHLFEAQHVYLKDSVMYNYNYVSSGSSIWAPKTKLIILKNKYRTWEWSKK